MDKLRFCENNAWEAARRKDLDGFSFWVRQWERLKAENDLHGIENPFNRVYQELENVAYQVARVRGKTL